MFFDDFLNILFDLTQSCWKETTSTFNLAVFWFKWPDFVYHLTWSGSIYSSQQLQKWPDVNNLLTPLCVIALALLRLVYWYLSNICQQCDQLLTSMKNIIRWISLKSTQFKHFLWIKLNLRKHVSFHFTSWLSFCIGFMYYICFSAYISFQALIVFSPQNIHFSFKWRWKQIMYEDFRRFPAVWT